jgi:hypothetical protein
MMGRLQTWIDRVGRSRRRKGAAGLPARRRSLHFELCESRLALSAATSVGVSLDSDTITYAELMADLWANTPGTARWVQVSFGAGAEFVATHGSLRMDYTLDREAPPPLSDNLNEGGLITLDSFATVGQPQFTLTRQSNAAVDAIVSRLDVQGQLDDVGKFQLNAGFDRDASATLGAGLIVAGPIGSGTLNLGTTDSGTIGSNLSVLPGAADSPSSWDFEPTDTPDLLGEAEGTSSVGEGGALNTTPPILRITAPLDPARTEGGRIDLTAMAGPTSLERQASFDALSAPTATRRTAARAADSLPAAASENLRARAVVYEVAYQRDEKSAGSADELGASLDDASHPVHETNAPAPAPKSGQVTVREPAAPPANLTSLDVGETAAVDAKSSEQKAPSEDD